MSKSVRRGITDYSDTVPGTELNYHNAASFDVSEGYVGVTQYDKGTQDVRDRVLLSPTQFKALVAFVDRANKHRRRRRTDVTTRARSSFSRGT